MKSYRAANQFRLVGKAWEIRHYLNRISHNGGQMEVAEWLAGPSRHSANGNAGISTDASRFRQRRPRQGRRHGLHSIPCPSSE
ncbi:Uncharacterised protein [Chlamydia abortus]|nr:Uncharacterised protein [Chlamydia abortus]